MKTFYMAMSSLAIVQESEALMPPTSTFLRYLQQNRQEPANGTTTTNNVDNDACVQIFGSVLTDGVWTSRGYGWALELRSDDANENQTCRVYEETEEYCIPDGSLYTDYDILKVQLLDDDENVAAVDIDQQMDVLFDRTDDFQRGCSNSGVTPIVGDDNYQRDALAIFDVFDLTYQEQYAFFDERGVDWTVLTEMARANLKSNSTDEELFDAMTLTLAPLQDYHVSLIAESDENSSAEFEDWFESQSLSILGQLEDEFANQSETEDFETYIEEQALVWLGILSGYLDADSLGGEPLDFVYGTANQGEIGYLQLNHMAPEDSDVFFASMDELFIKRFANSSTLILDVRINGGGNDQTGLRLASYFTSERTVAFVKRAKDGNGFTPETDIFIEPNPNVQFAGDSVILILSDSCGSAFETFAMAMMELPIVETTMGRNTIGALSYILPRRLPNGWLTGLSNEEYRTPRGDLYEVVGVPPDVTTEAGLLPLEERKAGIDSWMELALELAMNATSSGPTSDDTSSAEHQLVSMTFLFTFLVGGSMLGYMAFL